MGATNSGQNRIFYKLKVEKETNVPLFALQKKDSNGVWVVSETFNQITGFLKSVELGNYEWEGDTIDTVKFIFDDDKGGAAFQVETSMNYLSRSILNTLAGADNIGHVLMRVYLSKPNDAGKSYPQAYIEINKTKAGWKYKPEETPRAKDVKVGGKTLKDTAEIDAFFRELIPEINSKIISAKEVNLEMNNSKHTSELIPDNVPFDDQLPF